MKILLIWQMVPESIATYVFEADADMLKWLPLCHLNYVNLECSNKVAKALDKLSVFLESIEPIDSSKPFEPGACLVILSGFIM